MLSTCGGGDSSSGGGNNGTPRPTQFAGTYKGNLLSTLSLEGDGYLAALTNFRYMANAVWTTDEAVKNITG